MAAVDPHSRIQSISHSYQSISRVTSLLAPNLRRRVMPAGVSYRPYIIRIVSSSSAPSSVYGDVPNDAFYGNRWKEIRVVNWKNNTSTIQRSRYTHSYTGIKPGYVLNTVIKFLKCEESRMPRAAHSRLDSVFMCREIASDMQRNVQAAMGQPN